MYKFEESELGQQLEIGKPYLLYCSNLLLLKIEVISNNILNIDLEIHELEGKEELAELKNNLEDLISTKIKELNISDETKVLILEKIEDYLNKYKNSINSNDPMKSSKEECMEYSLSLIEKAMKEIHPIINEVTISEEVITIITKFFRNIFYIITPKKK